MIKLFNKYAITTDEHQFILGTTYFSTSKKTGVAKELVKPIGYYANIDQAVKALINKCISEKIYSNEISTLKDFINEYDILHKKIDALLLPLKL